MAYTAWSVVFGEQPTAAKWNQLGANDAGFRDGTNIDDDAILERHIPDGEIPFAKTDGIWWEELGRHQLSVDAATLSVSGLPTRKVYKILACAKNGATASNNGLLRVNGDTGATNYSRSQIHGTSGSLPTVFTDSNHMFNLAFDTANINGQLGGEICMASDNVGQFWGHSFTDNTIRWGGGRRKTAGNISSLSIDFAANVKAGAYLIVMGHN